jgi:hypothetical protein
MEIYEFVQKLGENEFENRDAASDDILVLL